MSRKTILALIIIVFIVIFGGLGFGYYYLQSQNGATSGGDDSSGGIFGDLFGIFRGSDEENADTATTSPTTTIQSENGEYVVIPRLRQVFNMPTAGAAFVVRNVATTTLVKDVLKPIIIPATFIRYVERSSGHIFETKPDSLSVTEISNTTVPKIYDASFVNGGNSVIYRYLDASDTNIETYYAAIAVPKVSTSTKATTTPVVIATSSTPFQLTSAVLLPENITSLAISPTKDKIFYLQNNNQGVIGILAATNNAGQKQIFTHPLREWLTDWSNSSNIVLTTKPSSGIAGFVFYLNSATGKLTKVFGNVLGLTTLPSPDLSSILYSSSSGNGFSLNLYTPKNGLSSGISLATLPEKCVWSKKTSGTVFCAVPVALPPASYPDAWYQGSVSFNDAIWKISTNTGVRELIVRPSELIRTSMDIINLSLDPNENYLMFINKKDLTLWNLLINPPTPPAPITATATSTATTTSSTSSAPQAPGQ